MENKEILKKIQSGEYTLTKCDGKSQCWKLFSNIIGSDGKELYGIACCSKCLSCITYKKKDKDGKIIEYGTTNLLGHMKHCNPSATANTAGTVKSYFQSKARITHIWQI